MFVWNAYLQVRNLLDKNAKRPNKVLLVSSILLFMMVTGVSCSPFRRRCIRLTIHLRPKRWVIGVYCFYDVIVRSGGRVSISAYFADLTQKWQICATSFIEFEIIVVDFILVSPLVLPIIVRILTRGPRYTACTMCGSPIGGFAFSPFWRGSAAGVSCVFFPQANSNLIVVSSLCCLFDLGYE